MKVAFAEPSLPTKGTIVAAVLAKGDLSASAKALDRKTKDAVSRVVQASSFTGKHCETLSIVAPTGLPEARIILVGLGDAKELDAVKLQAVGARVWQAANAARAGNATIMVDPLRGSGMSAAQRAAHIAYGSQLRAYRFDKYLTKEPEDKKPTLAKLTVMVAAPPSARRAHRPLDALAHAIDVTRDLVSEPGNIIYPASLAAECRKLSRLGVKVEVLGEKQMQALGMGAILGVGHGSDRESQLVVMQWTGAARTKKPVALIGKGVTFDSGGISIKPAGGMEEMKWDMGGAGAVIGAMHALAGRKARVNVVGVVGLVENMPSGTAQRPGDIVTSMSGQTIEVLNTDAEGRLVLADALWYTQNRFKPQVMVDLATLTGAIMVALGREFAGLFANDDKLAQQLIDAGTAVGEGVWRLPLAEAYDRQINSPAADVKNIGAGRWGGSITAAQFLQRFTNSVPWAHLDIAGVAWSDKDKPTMAKGATGFGVQLLDRFVQDNFEG